MRRTLMFLAVAALAVTSAAPVFAGLCAERGPVAPTAGCCCPAVRFGGSDLSCSIPAAELNSSRCCRDSRNLPERQVLPAPPERTREAAPLSDLDPSARTAGGEALGGSLARVLSAPPPGLSPPRSLLHCSLLI